MPDLHFIGMEARPDKLDESKPSIHATLAQECAAPRDLEGIAFRGACSGLVHATRRVRQMAAAVSGDAYAQDAGLVHPVHPGPLLNGLCACTRMRPMHMSGSALK